MLREGKSTAGDFRIPSGCAVSSVFSRSGKRLDGSDIIRSIEIMHDRSNGLGGGFAGYGIYPEYAEQYAFHVFYNNVKAKEECEKFINEHFDVVNLSKIPIRKIPQITDEPLIWRYFVTPLHTKLAESQLDEDEFTARCVNRVNTFIDGAYIFSSGKNMGVFKAVGYPEDVGRADQTCTGCGKCVKVCPLNNVTMKNKKPVWEKHCTHCMACICYCPAEAIEYGRKSVGKPRYCFENLGLEKYDYSNPLK